MRRPATAWPERRRRARSGRPGSWGFRKIEGDGGYGSQIAPGRRPRKPRRSRRFSPPLRREAQDARPDRVDEENRAPVDALRHGADGRRPSGMILLRQDASVPRRRAAPAPARRCGAHDQVAGARRRMRRAVVEGDAATGEKEIGRPAPERGLQARVRPMVGNRDAAVLPAVGDARPAEVHAGLRRVGSRHRRAAPSRRSGRAARCRARAPRPLRVAMAVGPDLGQRVGAIEERVARRRRAVEREPQHLAVMLAQVLRALGLRRDPRS